MFALCPSLSFGDFLPLSPTASASPVRVCIASGLVVASEMVRLPSGDLGRVADGMLSAFSLPESPPSESESLFTAGAFSSSWRRVAVAREVGLMACLILRFSAGAFGSSACVFEEAPVFRLSGFGAESSSSPLFFASSASSWRSSGMPAWTPVMSLACLAYSSYSSRRSLPASSLSELVGFGYTSRQRIVSRTSFSVSVGFQSRFSVPTQTSPERSSIFGWKILVLKVALGGSAG